jgi:hypothetical protein
MARLHSLEGFVATRNMLQAIGLLFGDIAKQNGIKHPRWHHMSLSVHPDGFASVNIPLPSGGIASLRLDFQQHKIVIITSMGFEKELDLLAGFSFTEISGSVTSTMHDLGLSGDFSNTPANSQQGVYNPEMAAAFFCTIVEIDRLFQTHLASIDSNNAVHLWPHGFDLSCEWYSSRLEEWKQNDKVEKIPAQLNLGFYPGMKNSDSYFYSNPWPFDRKQLLDQELSNGAKWHTRGWQGAKLPFIVSAR